MERFVGSEKEDSVTNFALTDLYFKKISFYITEYCVETLLLLCIIQYYTYNLKKEKPQVSMTQTRTYN